MHELPKDLAKSLRSWRGSVYGGTPGGRDSQNDLEKGVDDFGDKQLSPAHSSIVLHPIASSRSLRQARYSKLEGRQHTDSPQRSRQHGVDHHDHANASAKKQGTAPPQTPTSTVKQSVFHELPKVADPDPTADRLDDNEKPLEPKHFYELIGMYKPQDHLQLPKELAVPRGLYWRIRRHYRYIQTKYRIFDAATYIFLAMQLLLSAVFIVLGSVGGNYHVAIAVLGAVSTVIAGVLALMKGQGLPNRLRQIRDDLHLVLFEAEELYWDVAAEKPVRFEDIKKLREDFMRVLAEARNNHPDSWTGAMNDMAQGVKMKGKRKVTSATFT